MGGRCRRRFHFHFCCCSGAALRAGCRRRTPRLLVFCYSTVAARARGAGPPPCLATNLLLLFPCSLPPFHHLPCPAGCSRCSRACRISICAYCPPQLFAWNFTCPHCPLPFYLFARCCRTRPPFVLHLRGFARFLPHTFCLRRCRWPFLPICSCGPDVPRDPPAWPVLPRPVRAPPRAAAFHRRVRAVGRSTFGRRLVRAAHHAPVLPRVAGISPFACFGGEPTAARRPDVAAVPPASGYRAAVAGGPPGGC